MKYEKEIKILKIDTAEMEKKLQALGAELRFKTLQKISVYDLSTFYSRYIEIVQLLEAQYRHTNVLKRKLKLLLFEINDLLTPDEKEYLCKMLQVSDLMKLLELDETELKSKLDCELLRNTLKKLSINENKWIRLRESNGKIELTSKHILKHPDSIFQKVLESEILTSSFEETENLLNSLGIFRRNYQEKYRIQYFYKNTEIDIDHWPYLDPYIEIETDDIDIIDEIILKCDLGLHEVVSLNTEELYRRIGIDILEVPELCFQNNNIR